MIFPTFYDFSISGLILFAFLVFASSLGFPAGFVMRISYGAISENLSSLIFIIVLSIIVSILGDVVAYEIARKLSSKLRSKLEKFSFFKDNEKKTKRLLDKHGFWMVLITRFLLVALCAVMSYVAGFTKYDRKKFLIAVVSGAVIYSIFCAAAGYIFGIAFSKWISAFNNIVFVILLVVIAIYIARYFLKKKK